MLRSGTTVRVVVGNVYPPVFLPDVRTDLAYAIDTWRGDVADAWIEHLNSAGGSAAMA